MKLAQSCSWRGDPFLLRRDHISAVRSFGNKAPITLMKSVGIASLLAWSKLESSRQGR